MVDGNDPSSPAVEQASARLDLLQRRMASAARKSEKRAQRRSIPAEVRGGEPTLASAMISA